MEATSPTRSAAPGARLAALVAGLVAGSVAALPAQAAPALPTTCQGQPATIVSNGYDVTGTDGPDVIVANSAANVRALGGNDLVCIADVDGNSNLFQVDAGAGDDVVDSSAVPRNYYGTIDLGAGVDRFVGGHASERVITDGPGSAEDDHVETGGEHDSVKTGTPGFPNGDNIVLGDGDDGVTLLGTVLTGPAIDGGAGDNTVALDDGTAGYGVDTSSGTATRDGQPWARWVGFDHVDVWDSPTSFSYTGSDRDESVTFYRGYDAAPRNIDMAGGDDSLRVYSTTEPGERFNGGSGRDHLVVGSEGSALAVDLGTGEVQLDRRLSGPAEGVAAGFEGVHAMAAKVSLVGTSGADSLTLSGCRMTADGRRGADRISRMSDWMWESYTFDACRGSMRAVFRGGKGRDDVRGSLGNDRLYGGPGRDRVDGWSGRDLCRGEKKTKCER